MAKEKRPGKRVTIRLSDDEHAAIERAAADKRWSVAAWCAFAIEDALRAHHARSGETRPSTRRVVRRRPAR